jgi:hypothetical protein
MVNLDDLYSELSTLPKGTIVKKTIQGRTRFYLQWRQLNRLVSQYVSQADKAQTEQQIRHRQEVEKQLRKAERTLPKALFALPKNARELTGFLMEKDTQVAAFNKGVCFWLDEKRAPLLVKRTQRIEGFLAGRVIDPERRNSSILKKAMALQETDPALIALYSYGATLTDAFWFKPRGSQKHYQDIAFQSDFLATTALTGKVFKVAKKHRVSSPQLSLIGSYEKCWKVIDHQWWIIKNGTKEELFSEYFVSLLGKAFRFPMADYVLEDETIRSLNFAQNVDFEPMSSLTGDNDDYQLCFETLWSLNPSFAEDYLRLIWMDTLVSNSDRHSENFGLLRSREDGHLISLAPNFDNNASLISRGYPQDITRRQDGLISFFRTLLSQDRKAQALYRKMTWPKLTGSLLHSLFQVAPIAVDEKAITAYLLNGYRILRNLQK